MSGTVWTASYNDFRTSMLDRLHRVEKSLASLKNQGSAYADDHRRLIAMYSDVLKVVKAHKPAVAETHN